ncbi:MAG: glycosyltransferase, partial [Akkermansiaceae bacterium]|nr:glycosyltransferase [Akkermansiaceae bacterium]
DLSDGEMAERIRELGIDVLVDLAGLTSHHRAGVVARRPAPVQVSYMGYPATTGSGFHGYLVADGIVVPDGAEKDFSERVVRLPRCYLATDHKREIGATPERGELGLPDEGFVFCSFNGAQKITRELFEMWVRLIAATP